ncbi:translation elongation factor-like protein [Candidatus Pacearchaeota archaeon]|nr:translation elongation factor-like protein [Candidatus Pacearchaeota archaeon]
MAESEKKTEKQNKKELGKPIGEISNYFDHVNAAAMKLSAPLKKGDKIRIVGGEETDFEMDVKSMEVDRKEIEEAKAGDEIGLLVPEKVRKGYKVYKA